jgi:ElaB/YqjD/DUF883 family membrane-anchored ribosome-binding protein
LVQQAKESVREATVGKAQEVAGNVVDSAKQAANSAMEGAERVMSSATSSAREAGSTVMETIQRNPLPAALIATGIGWLWMNASRQNAEQERFRVRRYEYNTYPEYGATVGYQEQRVYGTSAPEDEQAGAVDRAKEAVGGAIDTAKEAVGGAVHTTRDAMGNAVEAARDTGSSAMEVIQRNPLPAALLATSVSWLWMNARKQSSAARDYPNGQSTSAYPTRYDSTYTARFGTQVEYGQQSDRPVLQQAAHEAQERVSHLTDQVKDRVGDVGSTLQQQAHRASDTYERWMHENPLAVGAAIMALGAAVGMAIPETPQERRLMGEARDRLMDRAQEVKQDVTQKVQNVAQEAMSTVRDEARSQGLAP